MYLCCKRSRKTQEGRAREMQEGSSFNSGGAKCVSYTVLPCGAIETVFLHGTSASSADVIAKRHFNERFTKRALMASVFT